MSQLTITPMTTTALFRRRRLRAACGEDRLSALPDDVLHLILSHLDTRNALATAALSRRWAHLPGELPALDFRVTDILPQRYHRCLVHRRNAWRHMHALFDTIPDLEAIIERYERRAMRTMIESIKNFLDADDDGEARRSVRILRLEFFSTHNSGSINRLIAKAVGAWGVEDLEVVVRWATWQPIAYKFQCGCAEIEPGEARLRSLNLANCLLPPLHGFRSLTKLVLQDMPLSTPAATYERVFTECPQLQELHLKCCRCLDDVLVVDAPMSQIRELVVDGCPGKIFSLRSLPRLERLAGINDAVAFMFGSVPCLARMNLSYYMGDPLDLGDLVLLYKWDETLSITDLVLRFTGPKMWVMPNLFAAVFANLTRLLVADVPSSWDVSWPLLLVEAAPSLEILHVHVALPDEEMRDKEIGLEDTEFQHCHLKELVMIGFQGTERQVYFVRFVMEVSKALRCVALFKHGCVMQKGLWDWEMVTAPFPWPNEDKVAMLKRIKDGISGRTSEVEVALG